MPPKRNDTDLQRLEHLARLVAELSAETDTRRLPGAILAAALELTGGAAGSLYLRPSTDRLCCEAVRIATSKRTLSADELAELLPVVTIPAERLQAESFLLKTFLGNRSFLIEDIDESAGDLADQRRFDAVFDCRTKALLSVPLSGLPGDAHGVMQLMSPRAGAFSGRDRILAVHLADSAGNILKKNQVIDEQKALFESAIQMIAGAVDEKFYLGADHCRRVPVLTMMLARAVNGATEPPFAERVFDQRELYELEVAAWLHDCGKLLTPVNLVEKSRKLETVFDRIELVRTRFEIVRRDEEIARLRAGLDGEELPIVADGNSRSQQMREELHFLTVCNHGKKSMTRADQQRIRRIAKHYRWIDRQMEEVSVLTGDEIANLSIESGTLNERERAKINNHALATLGMLDLLPFPAELQRVPEIVAGTRNGRDRQPLLQARILAIADTLVSVTAENRSYRKTNSLAEAMEILFSMRDAGRLDAELLDLLVRERLHQQYAAEFLSEEQRGFGPS